MTMTMMMMILMKEMKEMEVMVAVTVMMMALMNVLVVLASLDFVEEIIPGTDFAAKRERRDRRGAEAGGRGHISKESSQGEVFVWGVMQKKEAKAAAAMVVTMKLQVVVRARSWCESAQVDQRDGRTEERGINPPAPHLSTIFLAVPLLDNHCFPPLPCSVALMPPSSYSPPPPLLPLASFSPLFHSHVKS
eukprot:446993-Hanusia_phi.AAC.1